MAEAPPVPDDQQPPKRAYPRREVIAIAGFGGLALLGWQVTRTLGDDSESGSGRAGRGSTRPEDGKPPKEERERNRKPDSTTTTQPSTTQPSTTTSPSTTTASTTTTEHHELTDTTPVETTQPPAGDSTAVRWSDPATWGGAVPGATDTAMIDRAATSSWPDG
jgi:hypothetical protein